MKRSLRLNDLRRSIRDILASRITTVEGHEPITEDRFDGPLISEFPTTRTNGSDV